MDTYIPDESSELYKSLLGYQDFELNDILDKSLVSYRDLHKKEESLKDSIKIEEEVAKNQLKSNAKVITNTVVIETNTKELERLTKEYDIKREQVRERLMAEMEQRIDGLLTNEKRKIDGLRSAMTKAQEKIDILTSSTISDLKKSRTHISSIIQLEKITEEKDIQNMRYCYIKHRIKKMTRRRM